MTAGCYAPTARTTAFSSETRNAPIILRNDMDWIIIAFTMAVIMLALLMMLYGMVSEKNGLMLCGFALMVIALFLFTIYEPNLEVHISNIIYPHYEKN